MGAARLREEDGGGGESPVRSMTVGFIWLDDPGRPDEFSVLMVRRFVGVGVLQTVKSRRSTGRDISETEGGRGCPSQTASEEASQAEMTVAGCWSISLKSAYRWNWVRW